MDEKLALLVLALVRSASPSSFLSCSPLFPLNFLELNEGLCITLWPKLIDRLLSKGNWEKLEPLLFPCQNLSRCSISNSWKKDWPKKREERREENLREAHLVIVCFIKFSTSYNSQCLKITRNVSCFKYLNFRTKMTPVDFNIGFWRENSKFLKWKPLLDVRLFEAFSNTMHFRLKLNGFNWTFVWILSFILSSIAALWPRTDVISNGNQEKMGVPRFSFFQ